MGVLLPKNTGAWSVWRCPVSLPWSPPPMFPEAQEKPWHWDTSTWTEWTVNPGPLSASSGLYISLEGKGDGRGSPNHWRNCLRPLCLGSITQCNSEDWNCFVSQICLQRFSVSFTTPPKSNPLSPRFFSTSSFSGEDRNYSILHRGRGSYIEQTTLSSR